MQNLQNKTVKGYKLLTQIGTGGFGAVYRAYQATVDRDVAVKIILPKYANNPEFIRNFDAEARVVARLEHPFIVPLFDYWRDPEGAYLIMRYLPEGSLFNKLLYTGPLPIETTARMLSQLSSALDTAHRSNIIHRDIKPANILVDQDNNGYLTDFGLAKDSTTQKDETEIVGSTAYLAPEVIRKETITYRTDIYDLGFVLYEMLTGHYAFLDIPEEKLELSLYDLHLSEPLPEIPDQPLAVNLVLQRATAKDPLDRYPSAGAMAEAFRKALQEQKNMSQQVIHHPEIIINPYKGLQPFEEVDSGKFFGREKLIQHLIEGMQKDTIGHNFLALVGPSGSGKSSVVSAGLLPSLRNGAIPGSDDWFIITMVPGANPFEQLDAALHSIALETIVDFGDQLRTNSAFLYETIPQILPTENDTLLLVIDHFEELFTQTEDEKEITLFLNLLHEALKSEQIRIVVLMRADFYHRPMFHEGFGTLFQTRTQVILPLNAQDLTNVISKPAEQVGLSVEPELIAAMIADVRSEAVALPLLQYALTEVFERRDEYRLTLKAYRDIGGIAGALAHRADELFDQLPQNLQKETRQIFMRLVTLRDGMDDTRRRVRRSELLSVVSEVELLQPILDAFGQYRLLTFDHDEQTREPTIEVAHEALIREWGRLRNWLEKSRHDLRQERILQAEAQEWAEANEDPSYLLRGSHLRHLMDWAMQTEINLSVVEEHFLLSSIALHETEEAEETARIAHERELERRARQRLQQILSILVVASFVGALLTIGIYIQRQNAITARDEAALERDYAQRTAQESEGLLLASRLPAIAQTNPFLAYGLGLDLLEMEDPPLNIQAAVQDLLLSSKAVRSFNHQQGAIHAVAFSPDQKRILSASADHTLALWDQETGDLIQTFSGHEGSVTAVDFSPDGLWGVSASLDQQIILWDVASGEAIHRLQGHDGAILAVTFSHDGQTILSGSSDRSMRLWDTATGAALATYENHTGEVRTVAFSPDDTHAIAGVSDGSLSYWEITEGELIHYMIGGHSTVPGQNTPTMVTSVAFSPSGRYAISGSTDRSIVLWDLTTGTPSRTFRGHRDTVHSVVYSPDRQTFFSGSSDSTIIQWDIATGQIIQTLEGHVESVLAIDLSGDGQLLVSGARSSQMILWGVNQGQVFTALGRHGDPVRTATFLDETQAISASSANALRVWDLESGDVLSRYHGMDMAELLPRSSLHEYPAVRISPDGQYTVYTSIDGLDLRDTFTGDLIQHIKGDEIRSIAFSADSTRLIMASENGEIIFWQIEEGAATQNITVPGQSISAIALAPDDSILVAGSVSGAVFSFSGATGQELARSDHHTSEVWDIAFTEDSQRILTAAADNRLILRDRQLAPIHTLTGHHNIVTGVAITPDQRMALSSSGDGLLMLWDLATGEALRQFEGHQNWVWDVDIAPDGRKAVSGSSDYHFMLWEIWMTPQELRDWAQEERQITEITCELRRTYRTPLQCSE